jgi:outer membrane protein assembly factor BamB
VGAGPQLAALDPAGQLLWTVPTSSDVRGSPVVAPDGTIAFGDATGHVYSATAEGVLRWALALPGGPQNLELTPAVGPDGRIYAAVEHTLFSIVDGDTLWTANLDSGSANAPYPPSIADDGSIIVANGPRAFAFDHDHGDEQWALDIAMPGSGTFQSSAAIGADGTVYLSANISSPSSGAVFAMSGAGVLQWVAETQFSASPMAPTVGSDGNVYTTDPVQILHGDGIVSPTGIPVAQAVTPIVIGAGGTFYMVFNGALHAFGR